MTSKIDAACSPYVNGERGYYHWQVPQLNFIPGLETGGGMFTRKTDALDHMKAQLRKIITRDDVLVEYLSMKSEFIMDAINSAED